MADRPPLRPALMYEPSQFEWIQHLRDVGIRDRLIQTRALRRLPGGHVHCPEQLVEDGKLAGEILPLGVWPSRVVPVMEHGRGDYPAQRPEAQSDVGVESIACQK